jgi:hypothetical protein
MRSHVFLLHLAKLRLYRGSGEEERVPRDDRYATLGDTTTDQRAGRIDTWGAAAETSPSSGPTAPGTLGCAACLAIAVGHDEGLMTWRLCAAGHVEFYRLSPNGPSPIGHATGSQKQKNKQQAQTADRFLFRNAHVEQSAVKQLTARIKPSSLSGVRAFLVTRWTASSPAECPATRRAGRKEGGR